MNITTENLVAEIRHFEQREAAFADMLRTAEGAHRDRVASSLSFAQQRVRRLRRELRQRRKDEVTL